MKFVPDADTVGRLEGGPWCPEGAKREGLVPVAPKLAREGCGTCR